MSRPLLTFRPLLFAAVVTLIGSLAQGQVPDWPQFRGPHSDGKSTETGLLKTWPEEGPKMLWKIEGLGRGYSSISIVDGTIYTMGDRETDGGDEVQFVIAYDLKTQKELWATRVGPPHGGGGPRCTPTVDGDLLYVIGTAGDLVCAAAATGKVRWRKNFESDLGGKMMSGWKFSESPLVDGDQVVCTPGGKDATIVALNKLTGSLIWKCAVPDIGSRGKDGAGYSSLVLAEIDGVRQYLQILGRGAVGVETASGRFLWGYNRVANGVANITSPVARGNHVFVTTSYKTGCALLKLTKDGEKMAVEEVYFLGPDKFENHHGGVILEGDYIYGGDGQNNGTPVCLELLTGKIVWKKDAPERGSAAIVFADGMLYFRYDASGLMVLVEATPDGYKIAGKFTPPGGGGKAWPHPVIHDGKLYLRHNNLLMCYDVSGR